MKRAQEGAAFHQLQFLLRKVMETRLKGGKQNREGGKLLNKVSYGDPLPRGPTHYPSIYYFCQKRCPFRTLSVGI